MNGLQALKTARASTTRKTTKLSWGGATRPYKKGVIMKDHSALKEILPLNRKVWRPVKKRKNTWFKRLGDRALKLGLSLWEKSQGYYTIWNDGHGSSYRTLNEVMWHIEKVEKGK